jgi:hypothetical protein
VHNAKQSEPKNQSPKSAAVVQFPNTITQDVKSESALIACLCYYDDPCVDWQKISLLIKGEEYFSNSDYGKIYTIIKELRDKGIASDPINVADHVKFNRTKDGTHLAKIVREAAAHSVNNGNWLSYANNVALAYWHRQKALQYQRQVPASEILITEQEILKLENPQAVLFGKRGIDLMKENTSNVEWIIKGLIPTHSRTSLVSKPKKGKTWLALQWALAIAAGGFALGDKKYKCKQGDVLYMALEDGKNRLRNKLEKILSASHMSMPESFYYEADCPSVDKGGLALVVSWIERVSNPTLIVIDTLKKFRPSEIAKGKSLYDADYESTQALAPWVEKYGVSILFPHHANKRLSNDPQDMISGSLGLSGGLDNNLVIVREHNSVDAELYRIGRDYDDDDVINIRFAKSTCLWGTVDAGALVNEKRLQLLTLLDEGYQSVKEIGEVLNLSKEESSALSSLLYKMKKDGQVERTGYGKYAPTEEGIRILKSANPVESVESV